MKNRFLVLILVLWMAGFMASNNLWAADEPSKEGESHGSITLLPAQYGFVYGNGDKFQAHNWTKTGYVGGIKEFEQYYEVPAEDIKVWMEGHGLLDTDSSITRNDYETMIRVEKENVGFVNIEYEEFPKFYGTDGGVYYPFQTLSHSNLDRDLE